MNNDTQLQIDRMVDGELTVAEQHALLKACELNGQWRELALAYVESQVFRSELGASFVVHGQENDAGDRLVSPLPASTDRPVTGGRRYPWSAMSLAAAVLLSLGMGYGLGWWWQGSGSVEYSQLPDSPSDKGNVTQKVETMPFLVSDATGSEMKQVNLPLVNVSDLGPDWQQKIRKPDLPADLIDQLRNGGINVRQQRTMTRVRLPDGRLVVVPIDYFFEELFQ